MLQKAIRRQKVRPVGESEAGGFERKIGGQSLWNLELGGVKSFELLKPVTLVLSQPAAMGRPEGWGIPRGSQAISKTGRGGILCGGNNEATESHAWKAGGTHLRGDSHQPQHLCLGSQDLMDF